MIKRLANLLLGRKQPEPILMDWSILQRVFQHFEGRKRVWERRGIEGEYPIGHYFEFGCYNGDTLLDFFNALRSTYGKNLPPYWKMVAFDSFEGLPPTEKVEDLHPQAGEGSYKSDGLSFVENRLINAGCPPEHFKLVAGFYQDSLTEKLKNDLLAQGLRPSFVNIDCDYFSSALCALNWIEPLMADGTVVYFDDIYFYNCNPNKGELKAISEFNKTRKDSGLAPAPWFDTGGRCYMYWRNEKLDAKQFVFKDYVTG